MLDRIPGRRQDPYDGADFSSLCVLALFTTEPKHQYRRPGHEQQHGQKYRNPVGVFSAPTSPAAPGFTVGRYGPANSRSLIRHNICTMRIPSRSRDSAQEAASVSCKDALAPEMALVGLKGFPN